VLLAYWWAGNRTKQHEAVPHQRWTNPHTPLRVAVRRVQLHCSHPVPTSLTIPTLTTAKQKGWIWMQWRCVLTTYRRWCVQQHLLVRMDDWVHVRCSFSP
jgi:hypothetical protein